MPIERPGAQARSSAPAAAPTARAGARTSAAPRGPPPVSQPTVMRPRTSRPGRSRSVVQVALQVGGVEAGLGRVGVDVDLQVDRQPAAGAGRHARATRRSRRAASVDRIDRLDDVEELDGAGGLVALQVAHEVPLGGASSGDLVGRLLDAVLAEPIVAGRLRQAQALDAAPSWRWPPGRPSRRRRPARRAGGGHALEDLAARRGQRGDRDRRRAARLVERARGQRPSATGQRLRRRKAGMSRSSASRVAAWPAGTACPWRWARPRPRGLARSRRPPAHRGRRPRCAGAAAPACSRGSPGRPGRRSRRSARRPCRTALTCGPRRSRWR